VGTNPTPVLGVPPGKGPSGVEGDVDGIEDEYIRKEVSMMGGCQSSRRKQCVPWCGSSGGDHITCTPLSGTYVSKI